MLTIPQAGNTFTLLAWLKKGSLPSLFKRPGNNTLAILTKQGKGETLC